LKKLSTGELASLLGIGREATGVGLAATPGEGRKRDNTIAML